MSVEFEVLHALRVKGLASAATLSALAGVPEEQLADVCAPLVEEGLVVVREGRFGGYLLTPAGKARAVEELAGDAASQSAQPALGAFDTAFLPVNSDFKQLCHRWQIRPDEQPNDHTDAAYDAAVVADLRVLHEAFVPLLEGVAVDLPRLGRYGPRLGEALERVEGGDTASFARPMYDSYHDIWMELHNDVVLSLDRVRSGADEG